MGRGGRGRGGGVVRRLGVGERERVIGILVSRATGRKIECEDDVRRVRATSSRPRATIRIQRDGDAHTRTQPSLREMLRQL